jgi:hypothetical protein
VGARPHRRVAGGALAGFLIATTTFAGKPAEKPIGPGPSSITAEEAEIRADPAAGSQHGVILVEEASRDETGGKFVLTYHMRAKVLSPEGRKLADIEVPLGKKRSALKTWWGRTLLPDGRVLELPETALVEQSVVKSSKGTYGVLKGALEGVEPGAVIDYGFVVQMPGVLPVDFVVLEREWPVRKLRYVWSADRRLPAAFVSSRLDGRNAQVKTGDGTIVITAANLVPVKDEPYSPPKRELRATVILYYGSSVDPRYYWDAQATSLDLGLTAYSKRPEIQRAIAAMGLPEGDAEQRLRAAYEWMESRFVNADTFSAEELETNSTGDEGEAKLKLVVEMRRGTSWQIAYVYAAVARAIGADATLVYAVDRTEHFWNTALPTRAQFEYLFVGVRPKGKPDASWTIVQPVSGMPYGELPWRATGSTALLCTSEGMKNATLPPVLGPKNKSETHVKLVVDADETIRATWSRTAHGASGVDPRRDMRRLDPAERKERLEGLCRGGGTGEVMTASLPGLDEPRAPFRVECEVGGAEANIAEHLAVYPFPLQGAWWPETPELSASTRTFPVIFDYPRLDEVSLDVAPPPGFAAGEAPPAVDLQTPFGRYQWKATKTETGFHVERSFSLLPLSVKPPEYEALKAFLKQVRTGDQTTLPFRRVPGP